MAKKKQTVAPPSTGRRKESVARVMIQPGTGIVTINRRTLEDYFPRLDHREDVLRPLKVSNMEERSDVRVTVKGGGITGQAQAIRLGVARALATLNAEFKPALKQSGLLSRDPRKVERKKYGQPGARKRFQHSKR
ncbi:MAG: 30S ribosomal protein S9 [Candidatus Lindowbacteria bacterium]|nr:30S ribosomal protein S9 [Candidatus Lindowbacteria bacterium]